MPASSPRTTFACQKALTAETAVVACQLGIDVVLCQQVALRRVLPVETLCVEACARVASTSLRGRVGFDEKRSCLTCISQNRPGPELTSTNWRATPVVGPTLDWVSVSHVEGRHSKALIR